MWALAFPEHEDCPHSRLHSTPGSRTVLKCSCTVQRRVSQWPRTDKMQAGGERKRENCPRRETIGIIVLTEPKWKLNNGRKRFQGDVIMGNICRHRLAWTVEGRGMTEMRADRVLPVYHLMVPGKFQLRNAASNNTKAISDLCEVKKIHYIFLTSVVVLLFCFSSLLIFSNYVSYMPTLHSCQVDLTKEKLAVLHNWLTIITI